jgi:hypothetical protein
MSGIGANRKLGCEIVGVRLCPEAVTDARRVTAWTFPGGMLPPWKSFGFLQRSAQTKHKNCADQNYPYHRNGEGHFYTNQLVNRTPAATSAIQTRLFAFRATHCPQALEESIPTSQNSEKIQRGGVG